MITQYDLHNRLSYQRGISPQTQTNSDTALVSQIIDMADQMALEWVILTGGITDADVTFAVTMDESDASDLSGSNSVATTDMLGTLAAAGFTFTNDDQVFKIGYVGIKRYVRLTITPTGNNSGAAPLAVLALGMPRVRGNTIGS